MASFRRSKEIEHNMIVCPRHPDVTLTRERRGLFGRRMEVVHNECPRCQEEWPDHFAYEESWQTSNSPAYSQSLGFNNTSRQDSAVIHPSAPLDDSWVQQNEATVSVPHTTTTSAIVDQNELAQNITDMVHSLLDRDNPDRGPDFVVEQLEMLCAWTLGEANVRSLITEVGGIYIVTSLLQSCQERLGPHPGSRRNSSAVGSGNAEASYAEQHHDTASEQLDDASTIVTNDAGVDDAVSQFASMEPGDALVPPSSYPQADTKTSTDDASSQAFSHGLADTTLTNTFRQSAVSYPGCYYFPPTKYPNGDASQSSATRSAHHPIAAGQGYNHISPPPPTLNDIDRAFGHFFAPSSSSMTNNAAVGGDGSTVAVSQAHWTASVGVTASVHDDTSLANTRSIINYTSNRGAPSMSGSSVSAYVTARAPGVPNTDLRVGASGVNDRIVLEARWAVGTLANLCQDSISVDIMRSAGGVEILLSTLWLFNDDEMIQDCGCECLSNIVSVGHHIIKALILSYGAIATVLNAMRLFPSTPTLQHKCCLFLARMVIGYPVVLQSTITLKGIQLIPLAMRLHRLDEKLQEAACLALGNLMTEGERVYVDVVSSRGIEAILTAMWQFEANSFIQRHGCIALGSICANDDGNKQALVETGAVETILAAMRRHDQNTDIQKAGCLALCNLTKNYRPAMQHALDDNAISTLRNAAVHDPVHAKQLRSRLYKQRSALFKTV